MQKLGSIRDVDRSSKYAFAGFFLGILAPVGWAVFRVLFFATGKGSWAAQMWENVVRSWENFALYCYMGFGTAMVLGVFGYFIGKASQQIHERARNLDQLNQEVARQKEDFERRFRDLNSNLKNFHAINTHLQKSMDVREVMQLAADGLHDILGYDRVNILMVSQDRKHLEFVASRGGSETVGGIRLPLDARAGALYKTVSEKRLFLIEDITKLPDEFHLKPPCDAVTQLRSKHFIICPVVVRDEVVGMFGVDNKFKRKRLDDTDVDTVKLFADQVSSTLTKISLLEGVETLTRQLEITFRELLGYREDYSRHDGSLKAASASTIEATREIAGAADVVRGAVDSSHSSVGEISVSIEQVSQNLGKLTEFMEKSISAMTEISTTIKNIKESGARSQGMSETVKVKAEQGTRDVATALAGMQEISGAVEQAVAAINRLSNKSEEVNSITEVITEITQKTNLLALNAAIIAAQAGEHGRSFAVVADEVRNLSQEAASSTGAIAGIIDEIQGFTRETFGHIDRSMQLVQEEIAFGRRMEGTLGEILESAVRAMEMSLEISKATQEVARSADYVAKSIEKLGEMSSQVSIASNEQVQGTRSIVRSMEEVKSMTDDMAIATEKQRANSREIEGAVKAVSEMVQRIFTAMEDRRQGSREVIERLESVKRSGGGA